MASKRDYYEVLGLSRDATETDIKKAYRTLAKKYHPDHNNGDSSAETSFKEVNEAYNVLSDQKKRAQYDRFGHDATGANGFGGFEGFSDFNFGGVSDIFETFFGHGFSGSNSQKRNGPRKGADLRNAVEISFEEAAFGTEKEIYLSRTGECASCRGNGTKQGTVPETCPECKGTGEIQYKQNTPFGQFINTKTCTACRGEGKIVKEPCEKCKGTGRVKNKVKVKVRIPAGIEDGQTISLKGEGDAGSRGGPSGDLLVNIRVKKHVLFKRQGNDILIEVPITFVQGALGSEIDVPTLNGKTKYKIPEATQTGTVFKLKGKGIPDLRSGVRGDQYIKVNVEVPEKLNAEQKELLRKFAEISGDEYHEQRKGFFKKMKDTLGM